MTASRLTIALALAAIPLSPTAARAQFGGGNGSGYGNQGGYNQSSFSGGFGQQSGGFGGGFGQQSGGFGGGFGQQSGFGQQQGGFGGGFGQQGAFGQQGGFGQQQGGFGGGNQFGGGAGQGGQRNFVGRDSREVQNTFQSQFGQNNRGQSMADAVQNFNDQRESRRRWRDQQNAPPPIRVQLRPAPD